MKKLLIVESPAKIKTIAKFLGKEFRIMSTMGHIKDLPAKKTGVKINKTIDIEYVPLEGKESVIADICREAKNSDIIYLAPDPDREGEIIAWHVQQAIKEKVKSPKEMYRITFNEITKPAILQALKDVSSIDEKRVAAQQARRVLDRWVGYEVSPILWKKISKGLSAGRVQSVALRMICDREQAIRDFKPEEYWTIEADFGHNKDLIPTALTHIKDKKADIKNKKSADELVSAIPKESYIIDSITDKERKKNPYPPFMTSTLQQAAYNQLGFAVKKTMQLAQQLYEGIPLEDPTSPIALITYMRTDSLRISDTALDQVRSYIQKHIDKEYLPAKSQVYSASSKGKTQDAHEAIRPIDVTITPQHAKKYLDKDLGRLYELIWKRFVACQMKAAVYAQRSVVIIGGPFTFKITGSTLIFDGFLSVYKVTDEEEDKETKVKLPANLKEKDPVTLQKLDPKQHFTQPPARFTEASLVKNLEKEGIGRPSTYATILGTIRTRAYTTLDDKKRFVPTELGMTVTTMLVDNLPKIMDPKFTAHMETDLDKIEQGEMERDTLLREFYETFQKDLTHFRGTDGGKQPIRTNITCPSCNEGILVIRFGKAGEFLGCSRFPECSFTSNFKRNEQGDIELIKAETPALLEQTCPKCGKPLRQLKGKFGTFIACSGYPECKYIQQNKAGFTCPLCTKGDIVERSWRGGKFWGCSNYPKCKFAVFDPIEKIACPDCNWPFMIVKYSKDGKPSYVCANKECPSNKR
ncbi:MAG TPA: type I DNA topoisomerase [Candidatus Babeliales bacterium]|jgi:DNA topoisomerase-1|nr:type I DNA topoisomerase [Candidatus Babeliales bacterium]